MRRVSITALAAAASVAAFGFSTAAQAAVTVSGDTYAMGGVHSGQDCPITGQNGSNGFSGCWATQSGTVASQPANDSTASAVVAAFNTSGTMTDHNSAYSTIDGTEFTIAMSTTSPNTLLFTYVMGAGDPTLHYITIKQAGSGASGGGYELFYNAGGFTSGTTYSFNLTSYFPNTPGFSHLTVYDSAGAVPEPATWAMMLLGFGGIGMTMRRRRRNNALMQVA